MGPCSISLHILPILPQNACLTIFKTKRTRYVSFKHWNDSSVYCRKSPICTMRSIQVHSCRAYDQLLLTPLTPSLNPSSIQRSLTQTAQRWINQDQAFQILREKRRSIEDKTRQKSSRRMSEGMSEKENIEIVKKILEAGFQNLLIFLVLLTVCGDHLHRDHHHHDHHHRNHHHHDHHHRESRSSPL